MGETFYLFFSIFLYILCGFLLSVQLAISPGYQYWRYNEACLLLRHYITYLTMLPPCLVLLCLCSQCVVFLSLSFYEAISYMVKYVVYVFIVYRKGKILETKKTFDLPFSCGNSRIWFIPKEKWEKCPNDNLKEEE